MAELPKTARTLIQADTSSINISLINRPTPSAKLDSEEHLIRVHAVAICSGERLWLKNFPPPEPYASAKEAVPCYDIAGTVVTSPKNSPFQPGDEVYARTNYLYTGCASEYAIGRTEELAHRSKRLTWAESAALPLSAETAWQALFVQAGLAPVEGKGAQGKRIFITASSGGVGAWVVQLAKWAGATVVGTCGPDNIDFVKGIGADEVINYRSTDLKEWVKADQGRKVDLVIDCIGKKSLADAWYVVKNGGTLISIYQPPEQVRPTTPDWDGKDIKNFFFIMEGNGAHLKEITKLVDEGKCRPFVDSVWALEDHEKAFEKADGGHAKGKVVFDLGVKQ